MCCPAEATIILRWVIIMASYVSGWLGQEMLINRGVKLCGKPAPSWNCFPRNNPTIMCDRRSQR